MGHGLNLWSSQKAFLESSGKRQDAPFDTEFLQKILEWLKQNLGKSAVGIQRLPVPRSSE